MSDGEVWTILFFGTLCIAIITIYFVTDRRED